MNNIVKHSYLFVLLILLNNTSMIYATNGEISIGVVKGDVLTWEATSVYSRRDSIYTLIKIIDEEGLRQKKLFEGGRINITVLSDLADSAIQLEKKIIWDSKENDSIYWDTIGNETFFSRTNLVNMSNFYQNQNSMSYPSMGFGFFIIQTNWEIWDTIITDDYEFWLNPSVFSTVNSTTIKIDDEPDTFEYYFEYVQMRPTFDFNKRIESVNVIYDKTTGIQQLWHSQTYLANETISRLEKEFKLEYIKPEPIVVSNSSTSKSDVASLPLINLQSGFYACFVVIIYIYKRRMTHDIVEFKL